VLVGLDVDDGGGGGDGDDDGGDDDGGDDDGDDDVAQGVRQGPTVPNRYACFWMPVSVQYETLCVPLAFVAFLGLAWPGPIGLIAHLLCLCVPRV